MFLNRVKTLSQQSAVRLTLGLMLVFAVLTTLAGFATYLLVEREMNRMVDARLYAQSNLINLALSNGTDLPKPAVGQQYMVVSDGRRQGSLPFQLPNRPDGTYFYDRVGPEFRYLIRTTSQGARIVVTENAERQDELLDTLRGGMQVSVLGMLIAGLSAGYWFAVRGQRRLDLISQGLSDVAQGRLDTRITLPGHPDDLSTLAARINTTTARLAQSMEQMRVQSSNIAHDLRTPLARLRANIETSLIDLTDQGRAVDADMLVAALDQIDHIVGTFNAMLRLSRIESGAGKSAFGAVDLKDLAAQVSETFAPVVEDTGQRLRLEVSNAAVIIGDLDLLVQLVANLIQNALRYGKSGQEITLRVHGTQLTVCDQGPGIPHDERAKVLQPLYQLEKTRQSEGFGLGLSIVAAICALHDATMTLSDGPDGYGLKVSLEFPKFTNL